jgi:hypothetical protein
MVIYYNEKLMNLIGKSSRVDISTRECKMMKKLNEWYVYEIYVKGVK